MENLDSFISVDKAKDNGTFQYDARKRNKLDFFLVL